MNELTFACIGGGNLTEFVIENLLNAGTITAEQLIISDPDPERREHLHRRFSVQTTANNLEAVDAGDFVFINIRPQVANVVIEELGLRPFPAGKVIVTMAAGIPINKYENLGAGLPIVRALPNPPSQVGQGLIAVVFNEFVSDDNREIIMKLFDSMGVIEEMEEKRLNAVTSLTSPGSVLLFFESLIESGVALGLDRETATLSSYQTIVGVMEVWNQRQVSPYELLKEASTPGGITEASVNSLEQTFFRQAVINAIMEGALRAENLGQ